MKLFALVCILFVHVAAFSCGNEYGRSLSGERIHSQIFHLSDDYRSFDKEAIQNKLDQAIAQRGQREDDYENESNIALYYMKLGKVKKALQILEPLAAEYPDEYIIIANLGTAYELDGQLNQALKFIKKGYEINSESHEGSEWIHIKILEAKIAAKTNSSRLINQPIVTVEELLEHEGTRNNSRQSGGDQLALQIRTRVPFTPAPNRVIANLLRTYATYCEEHDSYENALMARIYVIEFVEENWRKESAKEQIDRLIEKIRTMDVNGSRRFSPMFMSLLKNGEIDPGLLLYAIDSVETQLIAYDERLAQKLDSLKLLRSKTDSLQNIANAKRKRIRIQSAGENGFFWGALFGTIGIIVGIIIASVTRRRKR